MKCSHTWWTFLLMVAGLFGSLFCGPAFGNEPRGLHVTPDILEVDTFFEGGKITIEGDIPEGNDVVIEILGPQTNDVFNVKSRMGPFWMTREKVHIDNAPNLYTLLLPKGTQWSQTAAELGFGVEQLKRQIKIKGTDMPGDAVFKLFTQLTPTGISALSIIFLLKKQENNP